MQIAIGIILIIAAIFLVVSVLLQSGKDHNLSGAIAGGAETFFGKSKATTMDKKLSKLTTIVAIIFALLVLVSYFMQDTTDYSGLVATDTSTATTETAAADDTTETEEAEDSEAAAEEAVESADTDGADTAADGE